MLSFQECNEEKREIFKKLKDKITKNSKNIIFTKDKAFGLLYDAQDITLKNLPLLIDFTTLIKMPKKFFPLIHDYKKSCNLNQKICKKISNTFEENYDIIVLNLKTQNNYVKDYIKDLDLLFADINNQKIDLEELENKLSNFYKFLCLIKENIKTTNDNQEQQTSEDFTTHNFADKMGKEVFNALERILNSINSNSINPLENTPQTIDISAINNEPLPLSQSNQSEPSTSNII
ncbi:hypothetical protein [Spiroplasma sp. AdecLV25b]|uniref:hypothetical protein n=1 Tax=Spiroplasma sp. AdecLV25b TaxID=3027162 RepID=UPI0027DF866D|nr:hypothetical protein [Spiroplasma sp. AdecLV25b]